MNRKRQPTAHHKERKLGHPRWAGLAAGLVSVGCALIFAGSGPATVRATPKVSHVLLLSLDGFHDFDLTNYVATHPSSALAEVVARGRRYANASAQVPSDSFPGTLAMATGGSPRSTGVYYDVSWDNNLSPAGSDCTTRGALVPFNQTINFNATRATASPTSIRRSFLATRTTAAQSSIRTTT